MKKYNGISMSERQSWGSLAMIWIGSMICVPSLMVGGLIASGLTLAQVILAILVGYGIVVLYMCFVGMQSCDTGLSTTQLVAGALGQKGSQFIISVFLAIACIGWFGVQTSVCAASFSSMFLAMTGINIPTWLSSILWGLIMLFTAIKGYKALKYLNYVAVPALIAVCLYGLFAAFQLNGTAVLSSYVPAVSMSFLLAVNVVVGSFALGGVISGDYSRFAKNRRDVVKSSVLGVLPSGLAMLLMGAVMSIVTGKYDITEVLAEAGVPALGLIALILATWTTNVTNAYSGGLAVSNLFNSEEKDRPKMTLISGLLGTALAAMGIIGFFVNFLSVISALVPPVAGVVIADYWIVGKGKTENFEIEEGFNIKGLIAFAIGAAVAYVTGNVSVFFLAPINGILVSMILYAALNYGKVTKGVVSGVRK